MSRWALSSDELSIEPPDPEQWTPDAPPDWLPPPPDQLGFRGLGWVGEATAAADPTTGEGDCWTSGAEAYWPAAASDDDDEATELRSAVCRLAAGRGAVGFMAGEGIGSGRGR